MFILPLICKVTYLLWPFSVKKLVALQNEGLLHMSFTYSVDYIICWW